MLVDPKGRDFERYRGASLVTPNRAEFEAVAGVCRDSEEMGTRARTLTGRHGLDALLVTLGGGGVMLVPAAGFDRVFRDVEEGVREYLDWLRGHDA